MRNVLNEVSWCIYVINRVHCALGCLYIVDLIVCVFIVRFGLTVLHIRCKRLKLVLNWANCLFAEHTSDSSTNYTSFPNWLIMRWRLRPELAAEGAADSMMQNVG